MTYSLCILICNRSFLVSLRRSVQTQSLPHLRVLLLDSSPEPIREEEWPLSRVCRVDPHTFDHGGTRCLATQLLDDSDVLFFITQDASFAHPGTLQTLVDAFAHAQVGAAFGRQLPRPGAGGIEVHARSFNYSAESQFKSASDIHTLGIKTAFISNSFAAYRRSALEAIGGFPERCIVSEDTYVAAKMLLAGWKIAYCADAQVYHSHDYNWRQEFQRYFDIGVFHAREPWVRENFGGAEGEGRRFFISEIKFLLRRARHLLISAWIRTVIKYLGFRVGLAENYLPLGLKRRLSMQKSFWRTTDHGTF